MEDPGLIIDSSSDDDADVTIVTVRENITERGIIAMRGMLLIREFLQ